MIPERRIPHLPWLAAFDAAARLGSFTAAAAELGVTQPAVTRQIRSLERSVGVRLFERTANRSALSDAGRRFAVVVEAAFASIERSIVDLRTDDGIVVIASPPGFAQALVVPYLDAIQDALGGRDIRLWLYDRDRDLHDGGFDVAIRIGDVGWPGCEEVALFDEVAVPVASPALATEWRLDADSTAADVLAAPLVHMESDGRGWMSWSDWLGHFGLRLSPGRRVVRYTTYPLVLQQAIAGRGVALGWRGIVDGHLDDGVLVAVGPDARSDARYSVAWPTGTRSDAATTLVDWLTERVRRSSPDSRSTRPADVAGSSRRRTSSVRSPR